MRKYRKQMKKAMLFLLLLALMVTMAQPFSAAAADQTEESAEETGEEAAPDSQASEEGQRDEVLPVAEEYENSGMGAEMPVPDESVDAEQESGANGDASAESELDVTIRFYGKDETGKYVITSSTKKKMKSSQTLKDIGVALPAKSSIYPGQAELTQTGWTGSEGEEITEDTPLVPSKIFWVGTPDIPGGWVYSVNIYAKYDKEVLCASYAYPDKEGHMVTVDRPIVYEAGDTYGEVLQKAQFTPEDMTTEYTFKTWEMLAGFQDDATAIDQIGLPLRLAAKFSGMDVLNVSRNYYDRKGRMEQDSEPVFIKEGLSFGEAIEELVNQPGPSETYPGLRFQKWEGDSHGMIFSEDEMVRNGTNLSIYAVYENCLIRYIIHHTGTEESTIFCQTAEKGETITALKSFQGFGEVTWKGDAPEPTFVVDEDQTFYGTAEIASDPAGPSKPSGSSGSGSTTGTAGNVPDSSPDNRLSDTEIEQIVRTVNEAAPGAALRIDMGSSTVVSKEILEAAKGKDVTLVLEMDGYSWTINGGNIVAQGLKDVDLRVTKNTDHIPAAAVQALAGGRPSMQISLAYDGNFGFQAELAIGMGTGYSGRYGNLFYYNDDGKMEFINAGMIDGNGDVKLIFRHASDYLIVVSDQMMSQAEVPDGLQSEKTTGQSQTQSLAAAGSDGGRSVKTGDSDSLCLWLLTGMSAIGVLICFLKRKDARS